MAAHRAACRSWRTYNRRDRYRIESQLAAGREARCPQCGSILAAQRGTRYAAVLPSGAKGVDLDCRTCRRFYARLCFSPDCRYILRLQRLAAAVLRA